MTDTDMKEAGVVADVSRLTPHASRLIQPDLEFKQKILRLGGHDLTSCYQCGTCSSVCPISTAENPFPRKEMVWVQWGLKDLAMGNSSIWLCHQCGMCTTYCPRDAKPADVMAALRDFSITHYATPSFLGRALNHPKYLPLLFAIPTIIFLAVLGWLGNLPALLQGQIVFSKFMPVLAIEIIFLAALALSFTGAAISGVRYWKAMRGQMGRDGHRPIRAVMPTLLTIFKHRKFSECEEDPAGNRPSHKEHLHTTHLAIFYGFMGSTITTVSVAIGLYVFDYPTPWPLWHPVKILGNVSGAVIIASLAVFLWRRIADKAKAGRSTYSDWLFLSILFLTVLTGFLSQGLRLSDLPTVAYPVYFVHLVIVFFLLVYIPYSKFAHLVYRTIAMLYEQSGVSDQRSVTGRAPIG